MKIVIDARLWSESGLGRYIRNLVLELAKIDSENQYYILLLKKDFEKIDYLKNNFHKVSADFKWYGIKEQLNLPRLIKGLNPDIVHFPHFNVPILYRGKFIVTIHDLIHQHYQTRETSTLNLTTHIIKRFGYKKVFSSAIKNSINIITPSEFVKKQLIKEWRADESKIAVTPEAVDHSLIDLSKQVSISDFHKINHKWNLHKPYIFYVGNAQPHKNIRSLINVFKQIKIKSPEYSLVLSGPANYFWEKIKADNNVKDIIFTGFVSERELVTLYKNAQVFIMPSLEEGFGIPVLEAMACDCPVVSSNAASLPEVGGEAVVYFNPKDESDMFKKISGVLENGKLRKELIKKGQIRFQSFSWKKLARQTMEVYMKA